MKPVAHLKPGDERRRRVLAKLARLAIEHAAQAFAVSTAEIAGRVRRKPVSRARYAALAIVRDASGIGLIPLGRLFGGRDHTTVLDALRRHRRVCEVDPEHRRKSDAAYESARPAVAELMAKIGRTVPMAGVAPATPTSDPFAGVRYDTAYRTSGAAGDVGASGLRAAAE